MRSAVAALEKRALTGLLVDPKISFRGEVKVMSGRVSGVASTPCGA